MTSNHRDSLPLVSIVIPVYNGSDYLHEAITSALDQSYSNCEVIVVNDGSSDNGATCAIAEGFLNRIRYFEKENGGVATALNMGIANARGEYVSWLSHDDLYFSHKIKSQIDYLNTLPCKNVVLFSDYDTIDVGTNVVLMHNFRSVRSYTSFENMFKFLITGMLHGCSFLIPASLFLDIGYFDKRLNTTQDYDMWFRVLRGGYQFIHHPEIVMRARRHSRQGTRTMTSICYAEEGDLRLRIVKDFYNEILAFPLRIVWLVLAYDRDSCKVSQSYLMARLRNDRFWLYSRLCICILVCRARALVNIVLIRRGLTKSML